MFQYNMLLHVIGLLFECVQSCDAIFSPSSSQVQVTKQHTLRHILNILIKLKKKKFFYDDLPKYSFGYMPINILSQSPCNHYQ